MNKIINPFVYNYIANNDIKNPTLPAWIGETYSQYFEDIIVESLLKAYLSKNKEKKLSFTYIEIGANHPISTNSTFLLNKKYGVNGILIEANPDLIGDLSKIRSKDFVYNVAISNSNEENVEFYLSKDTEISSLNKNFVEAWDKKEASNKIVVKNKRINEILHIVKDCDLIYLSIDIEGMDLDLIKDIDYPKYSPFLIQCEPSEGFKKGTKDEMIEFLKQKNYILICETEGNLIFINQKYI